jgi:hypothetical protein
LRDLNFIFLPYGENEKKNNNMENKHMHTILFALIPNGARTMLYEPVCTELDIPKAPKGRGEASNRGYEGFARKSFGAEDCTRTEFDGTGGFRVESEKAGESGHRAIGRHETAGDVIVHRTIQEALCICALDHVHPKQFAEFEFLL